MIEVCNAKRPLIGFCVYESGQTNEVAGRTCVMVDWYKQEYLGKLVLYSMVSSVSQNIKQSNLSNTVSIIFDSSVPPTLPNTL